MLISDFEELCEFLERQSIIELNYIDCYYDPDNWKERYFEVTLPDGTMYYFYPEMWKVKLSEVKDRSNWDDFSSKDFFRAVEAVAYDIASDYHIESCRGDSGTLRFNACSQNIYYDYFTNTDLTRRFEY